MELIQLSSSSEQEDLNKLELVIRERIRNRTGGFAGLLTTIYFDYAIANLAIEHTFLFSFFFIVRFILRLQNRFLFSVYLEKSSGFQ